MSLKRVLSSLFIFLCISDTSIAAKWDNAFGVGFEIGYVDNIGLAPPGEELSQYVAQLTPFVKLHGEGARALLDLDYQLQYLNYESNDIDSEIYHQLYATANAEFIEKLFFLDLSASNFQSAITDAATIPQDNISISDNRTNVTTTTISPYIETRVSSKANLLLRYTLNNTKYDNFGELQPDTENQSYVGEISSEESPVDWRLSYLRNEFNTNIAETNYYEETSFTLYYNINPQFVPFTTIGNEKNKIVNTSFDEGGGYWNVGLRWRPTTRTTFLVSHGQQFYGKSNEFTWMTKGRHTNIDIKYTEEVTNTGDVFAGRPPPVAAPPGSENEFIPISIRPYLRKRLNSNIRYGYSKTNINWYAFNERRIFLIGEGEDKSYGTTINWDWALTERTSPSLSAGWQRIQSSIPTQLDNELTNIDLSIVHTSSKRLVSSIIYRFQKQHSNYSKNDYTQNSIFLNFTLLIDNNN